MIRYALATAAAVALGLLLWRYVNRDHACVRGRWIEYTKESRHGAGVRRLWVCDSVAKGAP